MVVDNARITSWDNTYCTSIDVQRMWLLPVVQAGAMRWLSAEQAVVAAASGTAIGRAQYSRAAVPEAHAS